MRYHTDLLVYFTLVIVLLFNNNFAQEFHGGVVFPSYPGGFGVLKEFISKNLQYPEKSKKEGISGTVTISCLVNGQGKITNIKILRGINAECDSEAVRVIRLMPDWQPAEQWGKHISVQMNIPVEFNPGNNSPGQKDFTVCGEITDKATGLPLEGILVIIKGTSNGTITSKDGYYSLKAPEENSELEFSAIGYEMKSEKIGKNRTINSALIPKDLVIDFYSNGLK